jgi:DNA helicase-2/ATP-dependent DNA helicase PcrA
MHEVIRQLALEELGGTTTTWAMASELLERLWPAGAFNSKLEDAERKVRAEQMLETYLEWLEYNDNEIIAAELEFLFPLNGRNVKEYIDCLERTKDGEYVVIDFKTGSTSLTRNTIRDDIQMNTYCLTVLNKFGRLPKRASLVYIERNKMVNYTPDAEHVERQKVRLEGLISDVLDEEFQATPSFDCNFCGYGGLCDHEKRVRQSPRL